MGYQVVSTEFGYPLYSADIPGQEDVQITDQPHEAGTFGNRLAAQCMANSLTYLAGYEFSVVECAA